MTTTSSRASEAELLPCPFCLGEAKTLGASTAHYWVKCQGCGAEGPVRKSEFAAGADWNRRAASPVQAKRPAGMDVYLALLAKEIETNRTHAATMPTSSSHWAAQAEWLQRIHDHLSTPDRTAELVGEVERLRKVLEPFAKLFDLALNEPQEEIPDEGIVFKSKAGRSVTYGDFRRARAALKGGE
jgi:Lar family restriction alleviation protein